MTIYSEIDLSGADPSPEYNTYLIVDDFMRSSHPELFTAKSLNGLFTKFTNGSQIITVEYELSQPEPSENKHVRVAMQVDMQTFIFKELDYRKITKADLRKVNDTIGGSSTTPVDTTIKIALNSTGLIGAVVVKDTFTEKNILLFATNNQKFL